MLVLCRKPGETIHIGTDIIIKVTSVRGGRVQIGIEAPREVSIRRGDVEPQDAPTRARIAAPPACDRQDSQNEAAA